MPLSHNLPLYYFSKPLYDRLPQRLGAFVIQLKGPLICIDVGANIGDTIAAFRQSDADSFLGIEPSPHFRKYLSTNWENDQNVKILPLICSSGNDTRNFQVHESAGTATVVECNEGSQIERSSLDDIAEDYPNFSKPTIIKIDTDGHDFEVIRGARNVISKAMPALLFECDSFSNENYIAECLDTMKTLRACGYNNFILYDNLGNLLGKHSLENLASFKYLLFFQMTSGLCYFDILVMKDDELTTFYELEVTFITHQMKNKFSLYKSLLES